MKKPSKILNSLICVILTSFLLSACGSYKAGEYKTKDEIEEESGGSILDNFRGNGGSNDGKSGGGLFGGGGGLTFNGKALGGGSAGGSSVNEAMWRSAYEITSVLPINSASRQRGTIETDWYAPPGITHEQMRVVVFIGGGPINATGVKVNAFRRGFDAQGQVVQTPASETVSQELEKAILRRALEISNS